MSSPIQHLDHLKIPLEDIQEATNNFSSENFIRQGGFCKIYKGKLSRSGELIDIVARRLDTKYGQGSKEFWTEILMLSKLEHENLVSLVGFCDEKKEKIVINKYEAKGSLDNYITYPTFTWGKRLHICLGIARALSYIRYDEKRNFSIIHRNIKSSKILLNFFWTPKLSGFNLSMRTVASQRDQICIEDACGTIGYVDPTYVKTGSVTHKSDIYSFGVVLFEVLLGKKAITDDKIDIKLANEAKSRYEKEQLDDWINPDLREQMDGESLKIFSKLAYDCLNEHRAGRPNIDQVIMKLEKALDLQRLQTERAMYLERLQADPMLKKSGYEGPSSYWKGQDLEHLHFEGSGIRLATDNFADIYLQESQEQKNNLQISLADIKKATQDFSHDNLIGKGGFGQVYKGKLLTARGHKFIAAKRLDKTSNQGETELMTELVILSEYKHMNVIDLVSYCNEHGEKVIVYDYASKGSLDRWLKRKELTWRKRLEICIDIAKGLDFLHGTNDVKQGVVIHRDLKSANILLHDDWKASIADFGLSLISPINQDINFVIDNVKGTRGYCDPQYMKDGFLTKESDIYSFGVLLFEMLCGRFVIEHNSSGAQNLVHLVGQHAEEGTLYEMVFEATKKQMAAISMTIFQNIAYQCIHEERSKRSTACDVLIQLKRALELQEKWEKRREDLNISLDNIMLATQHFSRDNLIGKGDFWSVYKGQVTCNDKCKIIAAKRLDRRSDQQETEHMAELEILSEYTHENIISLVGYCNEKGEKIMVYEYASISKGSLDRWLKDDGLTWRKRLEICIDIARGLAFLHGTSREKQEVVIHGDIKSENVLLNDDWKAKIANFGQSLIRPSYCDPLYTTIGVLTKESDIYSLGVLLFEMLCGRSVTEHSSSRAHNLIHLVRDRVEEGTLYEIVFEATKKQMAPASLTAFQNIAYQCIHKEREKRPTVEDVLTQLKKALEIQEDIDIWKPKLLRDYKRFIQMTDSPEICYGMNYEDLYTWLHERFLHREHKVFFSFGANGGRVETISATEFQYKSYYQPNKWRTLSNSRFGEVVQISDSSSMNIQISVKPQLLSPGVKYGVYLVYKFCRPIDESTTRTHKLAIKMRSEDLFPKFTTRRYNDGWMRIELYRFLNFKEEANFDAFLKGFSDTFKNEAIYIEGVEFRPISNITREEIEELEKASNTNRGGSIDEDRVDGFSFLDCLGFLLCPCAIGLIICQGCFLICEACCLACCLASQL